MSVFEGEARVAVKEALPALGALTAFCFAWGLMQLLDRFCRALFGTAEGLVGWVPFAGKIAKRSIHKIEQKVSNYIGTAERGIDAHIASSYHKLAGIIRSIPSRLVDEAGLLLGVVAALVLLPTWTAVKYLIRVATAPLRSAVADLNHDVRRLRGGVKELGHLLKHTTWGRIAALAALIAGVLEHDLPGIRHREKAIARDLARLKRWVRHRRVALTTGAFLGAFVWALGKLGIGWIRCSNWRRIGKTVCGLPRSRIDALLGLLAGAFVLAEIRTVARFAEAVEREAAEGVSELLQVASAVGDPFTIP